MADAIRGYLALLKEQPDPEDVRLGKLAQALDSLLMVYHRLPDTEPDPDLDAPRVEYERLERLASASFPEFGFYWDVEPNMDMDQPITLGDGISDVAEIAQDLMEVLWLIENAGADYAIWMYRWGYHNHWGRHLLDLRRYLHSLMH
jgi:hypothetical protein